MGSKAVAGLNKSKSMFVVVVDKISGFGVTTQCFEFGASEVCLLKPGSSLSRVKNREKRGLNSWTKVREGFVFPALL